MKVLITGGAGFIGSNISDGLMQRGYEVVIVDNLSTGKKENISPDVVFYETDIRNRGLTKIFKKAKPQIVIHNAAQLSVRISIRDPLSDADINVIGGLNVINSCRETGVDKIIFASSGGTVYGEQDYYPAAEDHLLRPISPYGVAKLATEKYLNYYYKAYGLKYTALRYANIYGPRQDPLGEAGVVAIFINKIIKGVSPIVNGDGLQTRDYVYIKDAVEANIAAIESNFIGEVNISTGIETDVVTLFEIIKGISGNNEIREIHGPAREGEQRRSALSNEIACRVLGWKPETGIEEGLKQTYKWFEKNNKSDEGKSD